MTRIDRESAQRKLVMAASRAKSARVLTYSFDPQGWVYDMLALLPPSEICVTQGSDIDLIAKVPPELLKHKYFIGENSHAKCYSFLLKDNKYFGISGSMNAVPTNWHENCVISSPGDAKNDYLHGFPSCQEVDFNKKLNKDGLEFNMDFSFIETKLSKRAIELRARINRTIFSERLRAIWVNGGEYNFDTEVVFLSSMRDNWAGRDKVHKINGPQWTRLNMNFDHCGT